MQSSGFSRALICLLLLSVGAQAAGSRTFTIPAGDAADALRSFSAQSGLQMLFEYRAIKGHKTHALSGEFDAQLALELLLRDSGLVFEFVNARTVAVRRKGQAADDPGASPDVSAARLKLSQAATVPESTSPQAHPDDENPQAGPSKGILEVLVRGRRTSNVDIERSEDDVQPYVVFDSAAIERSMAGNIEQFLKTRLPMNAVTASTAQVPGNLFGNQSQVDLRGLGPHQTLILVNGRRRPNVTDLFQDGEFRQPDLNGIPLSAVERIEVLPSTASGIYGGGATGGVVNVVLKQDYSGVELAAAYDNSFDTDSGRSRMEINGGFNLEGGRTTVMLSASYSDSNPLMVRDRDFVGRARTLQLANDPAAFFDSPTPPVGAGINIRSASGLGLVTDDGISLDSPITFAPSGYGGRASDAGAVLVANAGHYDLSLPDDARSDISLLNHPTVRSAGLNLRRQFLPWLEGTADFSLANNTGQTRVNAFPGTVFVLADAPGNPFDGDIVVTFPPPSLDSTWRSTSETSAIGGGLIAHLPRNWAAQLDYTWSRSRYKWVATLPAVRSSIYEAMATGGLDVLNDLSVHARDYSFFLLPSPNFFDGPVDTVLQDTALRLAGPALDLPAGPLALSFMLEHRREVARAAFREDYLTDDSAGFTYAPPRSQSVASAYLEATAPLISVRNARRFLAGFDFQASVRRDEYRTTTPSVGTVPVPTRAPPDAGIERITNEVASTDYTLGVRYSPVPGLTFRASHGTGFLPPSIGQLSSQTLPFSFMLAADPKRDAVPNFIFPVTVTSGGRADLAPEKSRSWSVGVVFSPRALPDLRLSLDYTRVRKTDELFSLSDQEILDYEDRLPGRVTRAPLTAEDIELGFSGGQILTVDRRLSNIARTEVEAYDMQADYGWVVRSGLLRVFVLATLQPKLARQVLPEAPALDGVGFLSGPLRRRGNGGLSWERGGWTAGWNFQYYDGYRVYFASGDPALRAAAIRGQGRETVASQLYHDLFFKYRFSAASRWGRGFLADTQLTAGTTNVLNTAPPTLASTAVAADGYSAHADPRLRVYSISINKRF